MPRAPIVRLFHAPLAICAVLLTACSTAQTTAQAPAAAQSDYLTVTGGRIYYEVAGQGPAIVLIHGGFGDRRMWDAQFANLARDFRVVRYDHRGFGRSSVPDTSYSAAGDLLLLLDKLGIAKAHFVGNSMGGGTALDFALLHPDRVNKVVVVGSGANGYPYVDADFATMAATFKAGEEQGVDTAAAMWLRDPMVAVASRLPGSAALVRQMVIDNKNIFRMRHWPWEPVRTNAYNRLSEVRMPVLLIVGEKDVPIVLKVAAETAARLPNAQIYRMPDADHLPQLVDPEGFTRRLREFLK